MDIQVTKLFYVFISNQFRFIFFPNSFNECDNIEVTKLFKKEIPESKKRVTGEFPLWRSGNESD